MWERKREREREKKLVFRIYRLIFKNIRMHKKKILECIEYSKLFLKNKKY